MLSSHCPEDAKREADRSRCTRGDGVFHAPTAARDDGAGQVDPERQITFSVCGSFADCSGCKSSGSGAITKRRFL